MNNIEREYPKFGQYIMTELRIFLLMVSIII
jgi:hypothetical protein